METSREDVGIAIRSAFLQKGTQQRFSLIALLAVSIILLFVETIETKPLNYVRAFIKDTIYRGSLVVSLPSKGFGNFTNYISKHVNLYENYKELKEENTELRDNISKTDFLELENTQLRKLIEEQVSSPSNLISARVMIDKQSPYLNSFIINVGSNKNIKNGMAALDGTNFIGMGSYSRANAEVCLLGKKGKPKVISHSVRQVIESIPEQHSKKPDEVRERIVELCGDVSRIELFATKRCKNWDSWGNAIK